MVVSTNSNLFWARTHPTHLFDNTLSRFEISQLHDSTEEMFWFVKCRKSAVWAEPMTSQEFGGKILSYDDDHNIRYVELGEQEEAGEGITEFRVPTTEK
jgi:hypothetical protein